MKLAYIAGPYRNLDICGVVENIRRAESVAVKYWKLGYAVICPHKNTALLDGHCPDSVWLEGDLEMVRRCDVVVAMRDWVNSAGARAEVALANELDIPVIYD